MIEGESRMRTGKKIAIALSVLILAIIGGVGYKYWPQLKKEVPQQIVNLSSTDYSMEIVYDGDHYKINHPIFNEEQHLYIALDDLKHIAKIDVEEQDGEMHIKYKDNLLKYKDSVILNSNAKENEVQKYITKDEQIFIPDRHIEKFLGIDVDYFMNQKTKTIALKSPEEQQKINYDQSLGTTLFVHKNNVPTEKYEPRNGLYLGGYVLQDEFIDLSMNTFNRLTDKQHATYFKYVGYGKPFPKEWVEQVVSTGGFPQIAWEPNNGLEEVQDDEYLLQFALDAKEANVPILLRYASEMNGTWTFYSGNSELYIEKWKLVHSVMKEHAPQVMMLWNVFTMPEYTIKDFYPGDDYVDYVGVNIYNVVYHNDQLSALSDFEDPLRLLDYVYNEYSHKKPIVIGEFGATNYNVTDGLYHVDFAVEKINRMYKHLPHLYPRVKNIYYFDVNNLVNAPEGRKINNYAITENPRILEAYAKNVTQPEYLTTVTETDVTEETFSYRDFLFYYENELFVDQQFVRDFLGMQIEKDNKNEVELTYNGTRHTIKKEKLTIDKAAFFEKREINAVSLDEILEKFNLSFEKENQEVHIFLNQ